MSGKTESEEVHKTVISGAFFAGATLGPNAISGGNFNHSDKDMHVTISSTDKERNREGPYPQYMHHPEFGAYLHERTYYSGPSRGYTGHGYASQVYPGRGHSRGYRGRGYPRGPPQRSMVHQQRPYNDTEASDSDLRTGVPLSQKEPRRLTDRDNSAGHGLPSPASSRRPSESLVDEAPTRNRKPNPDYVPRYSRVDDDGYDGYEYEGGHGYRDGYDTGNYYDRYYDSRDYDFNREQGLNNFTEEPSGMEEDSDMKVDDVKRPNGAPAEK
ncbi:hypothetical protein GYMLUDRAFT_45769 [Collybiopsis luxurians FD-317 M1]|uniref:Uncharacterized protein n=1 Tax=Collybiopsis luxurians FD-317 M1 TaxID=944289 RepID=A0A0D0C620_9AGAR|nr:hypothetical protein GYMLUDRAFT_45769 [Collybiopsis luxurians FD-317 M1]